MSFEQYEYSAAGATPVYLYLFTMGSKRWAYCTGDIAISHAGVTYEPFQIADDGVRISGEAAADGLKITIAAGNDVAQLYRGTPPGNEVFLDVRYIDAEFITGSLLMFSGSVLGVNFVSLDRAEITCQSLRSSFAQYGLRQTWTPRCIYAVFSDGCNLDPADFRYPVNVTAVSGNALTVTGLEAFDDGVFTGGFVRWQLGVGEYDRRTIEQHVGNTLTIFGGADGITLGALDAHPGCPRTIEYCHDFFDNRVNYPSPPGMPGVSPFDGTVLF